MNEDYLWDKSGEPDAEIERLENALQAFRYKQPQETALPENIIRFKKETLKPLNRFFSLPFAIAASLAFIFLSVVLTLALRNENNQQGIATSEFAVIENGIDLEGLGPAVVPVPVEPSQKAQPIIKKLKRKAVLLPPTLAKKTNVEQSLDAESKYALGQLLKALQITTAKLNLIKKKVQTVEGIEPQS